MRCVPSSKRSSNKTCPAFERLPPRLFFDVSLGPARHNDGLVTTDGDSLVVPIFPTVVRFPRSDSVCENS